MSVHLVAALLFCFAFLTGCGGSKPRVNLFEGTAAQDALTELSGRMQNPVKALNVEITPLALTVRVQDPTKPDHVDEYRLEHVYALRGSIHHVNISGPAPVKLSLINEKLDENLFPLGDVNLAGAGETAKAALARTAVEDGVITGIRIERQLFLIPTAHSGEVEWNISVKGPREEATASADAKGRITRLNLDGTRRAKNLNLFANAQELQGIIEVIRDVLGPAPVIKLMHVERNYLWFDARDPKNPKRLRSFTANLNGVLMSPEIVHGSAAEPMADDEFFAVEDVDWALLPELLAQTTTKLEIPGGKLGLVTLSRPMLNGNRQPVQWNIAVQNSETEEKGFVEFDARGAVTQVRLPQSRRGPVNMFEPETARQAIAAIRKSFGPHARLIELMFDHTRAIFIARDPKHPERLRDFLYDTDHFVDMPGSDMTPFYRGFSAESFFDLDDLESTLMPQLAALEHSTLERLNIPDGKLERVTIARQQKLQRPGEKTLVEIRVANGGDKAGWVIYDLAGKVVSVNSASSD